MVDQDEVLLYSNHFKRCRFFEDTVRRLADAGYTWVILHTGPPGHFRECQVEHPFVVKMRANPTSYDSGMMTFKGAGMLEHPDVKYLVHIDNDCYLSGLDEFEAVLEEFVSGCYDYACHLVGRASNDRYASSGQLSRVDDQMFKDNGPNEPPTPEPHYENAYQIIRKQLWDKLSMHDVGHHRRFLKALADRGAVFGARKASYHWDYSNYGKEWFHVGHLFEKHLQLEANNRDAIRRYNPESDFDLFRAGYFAAQEEYYGDIYPAAFKAALAFYWTHMGGRTKCLDTWTKYTTGTCMENWKVYK